MSSLNTPVPTSPRSRSSGIPPAVFWPFVGAAILILALAAAFLFWRWRQRQNRRVAERTNAARTRTLNEQPKPFPEPPIPLVPLPPLVHGHGILRSTEADSRPGPSFPRTLDPTAGPSEAERAQEEKIRRAHVRRLAALREAQLKEAARRAQISYSADVDPPVPPEAGPSMPSYIYALDDTISRSDDSRYDVFRRGPPVNPAYQAARDQQYHQRIAAGYTHEQAMSVSEASTEESEGPGPLAVSIGPPRRAQTPLPGTHLVQPVHGALGRTTSVQFAPLSVPERWQPRATTDVNPGAADEGNGNGNGTMSDSEGICLREPLRPRNNNNNNNGSVQQRDSWRFSQVDVGFTETDDTATRASTVISDDPWLHEVLENRRRHGT